MVEERDQRSEPLSNRSNRVETVLRAVALLVLTGGVFFITSVNNDKAAVTDSNSNDIKLPPRSGYLVDAEVCYRDGNCVDPVDGALWRKLQAAGYNLDLLETTSKSPDPRTLTRETPAFRLPIPISDGEFYKEAYLGSLPAGRKVFAIAEAGVGEDNKYLLIYPPTDFPQYKGLKQAYIPQSRTLEEIAQERSTATAGPEQSDQVVEGEEAKAIREYLEPRMGNNFQVWKAEKLLIAQSIARDKDNRPLGHWMYTVPIIGSRRVPTYGPGTGPTYRSLQYLQETDLFEYFVTIPGQGGRNNIWVVLVTVNPETGRISYEFINGLDTTSDTVGGSLSYRLAGNQDEKRFDISDIAPWLTWTKVN